MNIRDLRYGNSVVYGDKVVTVVGLTPDTIAVKYINLIRFIKKDLIDGIPITSDWLQSKRFTLNSENILFTREHLTYLIHVTIIEKQWFLCIQLPSSAAELHQICLRSIKFRHELQNIVYDLLRTEL